MAWEMTLTRPLLEKLDPYQTAYVGAMAERQFKMMRKRVGSRAKDKDGRSLPRYRPAGEKTLSDGELKAHAKTLRQKRKGRDAAATGWNEKTQGDPPDILYLRRQLGGHWLSAAEVKKKGHSTARAQEIRYSKTSAVRGKRGRIGWYRWADTDDFLRDVYGGTRVEYTRTGDMWRNRQIRVKAQTSGKYHKNPTAWIRFKGSNPKGRPLYVARKYAKKKRMPPSIRAFLTNARDSRGGLDGSAREWLQATRGESDKLVSYWGQLVSGQYKRLPKVTIKVSKGRPRKTISGSMQRAVAVRTRP